MQTIGALDHDDHAAASRALLAGVDSLDDAGAAFVTELAAESAGSSAPAPVLQPLATALCGSLVGMRLMSRQQERVSRAALAMAPAVDSIVRELDDVRPLLRRAIDDAEQALELLMAANFLDT